MPVTIGTVSFSSSLPLSVLYSRLKVDMVGLEHNKQFKSGHGYREGV